MKRKDFGLRVKFWQLRGPLRDGARGEERGESGAITWRGEKAENKNAPSPYPLPGEWRDTEKNWILDLSPTLFGDEDVEGSLYRIQRRAQPAANGYGEVPAERAIVAEAAFLTVPIVAGQN